MYCERCGVNILGLTAHSCGVITVPAGEVFVFPTTVHTTCVECGALYPMGNYHECPTHLRRNACH